MKQLLATISVVALMAAPVAAQTAKQGGRSASSAATPASTKPSAQDREFVRQAASGGVAEVEEGKLAEQRAQHDTVKTFAQQMIADHSKANDELQAVASRAGVTPPTEPDKNHAARLARLGKLTGPQFDKTYIQGEIPEHWET